MQREREQRTVLYGRYMKGHEVLILQYSTYSNKTTRKQIRVGSTVNIQPDLSFLHTDKVIKKLISLSLTSMLAIFICNDNKAAVIFKKMIQTLIITLIHMGTDVRNRGGFAIYIYRVTELG
ncbi:MAG TPA: hypothetical protein DEF35_05615 [Paenibacillus sp.]|nr:hypothetical protein CA599_04095 [Paenibacillus taichungensis]HBU81102.1 hypothetical protein [Paenibacillus sp.]